MAEASSIFKESPLDEEFYCPICRDVFKTPVRTASCQHVFCRKCFMTAVKTSESHCPMCRGPISRMERCAPQRATDVDNDMKKFSGNCKCCGKQVKFSRMRLHYQCCYEYQKEYGCKPKNPYPSFFPPLTGYRAHSMFQCPVCQENGFDRKSLVEHCNSQHSTQIVAKVCPICASLPWGDPTYVSSNLVGHLNARHKFIYEGEYASLFQDEDVQYQAAIMEYYEMRF